jgi:hypothetical protein
MRPTLTIAQLTALLETQPRYRALDVLVAEPVAVFPAESKAGGCKALPTAVLAPFSTYGLMAVSAREGGGVILWPDPRVVRLPGAGRDLAWLERAENARGVTVAVGELLDALKLQPPESPVCTLGNPNTSDRERVQGVADAYLWELEGLDRVCLAPVEFA